MSRIDEIYEAYYKGQAAAANDTPLDIGVHYGFGHVLAAMMPFADSDETIAFEKGYHGEELELCYECEHVKENCECERASPSKRSSREKRTDDDDGTESSGEAGSSSSSYGTGYSGGGSSATSPIGCLPISALIGAVGGGVVGIIYAGSQIAKITNPNNVSLGLQCGIPILAVIVGALGLWLITQILKLLVRSGSGTRSKTGRNLLIGSIVGLGVFAVVYALGFNPLRGWTWPSYGSKSEATGPPFDSRHWKIDPFTKNDNRKAKLLWAYRFSLPYTLKGCTGDEQTMWIEPNSVVFVRVTEGSSGTFRVGTPDEQRTVTDTSSWMVARFVTPGQTKHPADFQISKRKLFVICTPSENMVVELEARRLPK